MLNTSSPRQRYYCSFCRKDHHLGQTDCDGLPIGWIEEDGTPFISRRERDVIIGSAALREELFFWSKTGGLLGLIEDPYQILLRNRVLLENCQEVLEELSSDLQLIIPTIEDIAERSARLN